MVASEAAKLEDQVRQLCLAKRIRPSEFFIDFDRLRSGYVTDSQFFRVLWENLGVKLEKNQEKSLVDKYNFKGDGRVNYRAFCNVIDQNFNPNVFHTDPALQVMQAPEFLGTEQSVRTLDPDSEARVQEVLLDLAKYYRYRGINLRTSCQDFDWHHIGIIQESQFYRSFPRPPQLTDLDLEMITQRYHDPKQSGMVNYLNLHHDIVALTGKLAAQENTEPMPAMQNIGHYLPITPGADPAVQQILDKIRIAVYKGRVRTLEFFRDYDKLRSGIITEHQFGCGLSLAIGKEAQLSRPEMQKLVEFYRVDDGRVRYKEFCDVMENVFNIPELEKKPLHTVTRPGEGSLGRMLPALTDEEEDRLQDVLKYLSREVRRRRLMMYQYFKDYDRSQAYSRVITASQFSRVLHFLTLNVAADEFKLLCRKFADPTSGDINYPAFVQCIDQDFVNYTMSEAEQDPIGKVQRYRIEEIPKDTTGLTLDEIMVRLRHHVLTNRLRVVEYFQDFDPLRSGMVTKNQFRRCLSDLGISALGQFNLNDGQFYQLCKHYESPTAKDKVVWIKFMNDVETVFTQPNLEKNPTYQVPASEVFIAPKSGTMNWEGAEDHHKEAVDNILGRIRNRAEIRRVLMKPVFQDFDKHNNGHVTRPQFRQALTILEIPAEQAEMLDLEARFCDDMGFNYKAFLEHVQPELVVKPMYVERLKELRRTNDKGRMAERRPRPDLDEILDKIKRKVCLERVRIHEWMRDFDKLRSGRMFKTNFRRCLDLCRFDLQESELSILEDHYQSMEDSEYVNWLDFSKDIESIFTTDELEKAPLLEPEPLQPLPEWTRNRLPEEEEEKARQALNRLAEKVRKHRMQLFPLFEDYDRVHNGMVSRSQFRRVLNELNLASLIPSDYEWGLIWKMFTENIGGRDDVNYVAFCDYVYDLAKFEWRKP